METTTKVEIDPINGFNKNVKMLIRILKVKYKRILSVERLWNRISIVTDNVPDALIDIVGLELWEHRERIKIRDEHFFLYDFNASQIEQHSDKDVSVEEIRELVELTKQGYRESTQAEKNKIYTLVREMLSNYAKWKLQQKNGK